MLILSPCAALSSFDAHSTANLHGTPEDYDKAKHSGRKCVVMLASDNCGYCHQASPHFDAIAMDPANENVDFLKLKSSENRPLMDEQKLDGVPAFIFLDENGNVKDKEAGFAGEEHFRNKVRAHAEGTHVGTSVDAMSPVQEAPAHEEGIFDKLKGLVVGLFETIKNIFVSIFDWIKGLFNR